ESERHLVDDKRHRSAPIKVFDSKKQPLPADFQLQGLLQSGPEIAERDKMALAFVKDSKAERGVIGVYQDKRSLLSDNTQGDKKKNCAGPLIWWGIGGRDAALKACQENKLP